MSTSSEPILPDHPSSIFVHAPGRVNIIGEHTDYNGGTVLPCAIDQSLSITISRHDKEYVSIHTSLGSAETRSSSVSFTLAELETVYYATVTDQKPFASLPIAHHAPSWSHYVIGAWCSLLNELTQQGDPLPRIGVNIQITGDLPAGGGLSSSAALCTGTLSGLLALHHQHRAPYHIAKSAMLIEHQFAGTRCGLMDQLAIIEGQAGHLTLIDFGADPARISHIPVPPLFKNYEIVIINSGVAHSLASGEYNERRRTCEGAVAALNAHFNVDLPHLGAFATPDAFQKLWKQPRSLDGVTRLPLVGSGAPLSRTTTPEKAAMRVRHVIGEIIRVEEAVAAVTVGNGEALMMLMHGSHQSLRDNYEVSCSEIELLWTESWETAQRLSHNTSLPPIIGPRLCGGGFGGSIVQLVHKDIADPFCQRFGARASAYESQTGIAPRILRTSIANGVRVSC